MTSYRIPTVQLDIPARFYEDHRGRDCGETGIVVKRLASKVRVQLDRTAYDDLLSDAEHYAGDGMSEWWDEGRGVILSARATVKALRAVDRPAAPERYRALEDRRILECRECSKPSTGFLIPADERDEHDDWHDELARS